PIHSMLTAACALPWSRKPRTISRLISPRPYQPGAIGWSEKTRCFLTRNFHGARSPACPILAQARLAQDKLPIPGAPAQRSVFIASASFPETKRSAIFRSLLGIVLLFLC